MRAFHGKAASKAFYVRRMQEHQRADEIIKGTYWTADKKGCAVGCLVHSRQPHLLFPERLGIPVRVAFLADMLFELGADDWSTAFAVRFIECIPVGADLGAISAQMTTWMLEDPCWGAQSWVPAIFQPLFRDIAAFVRGAGLGAPPPLPSGWDAKVWGLPLSLSPSPSHRYLATAASELVWSAKDPQGSPAIGTVLWSLSRAFRETQSGDDTYAQAAGEHLLDLLASAPVPEAVAV
jgi:hypothetical protein